LDKLREIKSERAGRERHGISGSPLSEPRPDRKGEVEFALSAL